ncbi:MAG: hypothetical protein R3B09_20805 [Nannocystaceae bacterium]
MQKPIGSLISLFTLTLAFVGCDAEEPLESLSAREILEMPADELDARVEASIDQHAQQAADAADMSELGAADLPPSALSECAELRGVCASQCINNDGELIGYYTLCIQSCNRLYFACLSQPSKD